ncbi:MAG TPA: 23S rRNA (adenine(2503)-C(2))-methyltransferase RlmN [Marinilabiliales bacterium]|jgi:23S rRNA (adenine2503-C2)-methyltransferase|nr:MAG: 23S rRNA (adenine(2503)-C(2))-methyltransferase [Bacteroidetes bacterium GWA2_40_14]OFX59172.1 MAG: 23S rRNA (adenine(2503)-C(2))-methyltransferase [Bacteroidetes bacterium GWC2_40_13]OFX73105.1 MAG: 23S rRNA (adenine(2503)-C(2))-methyltransferase [Bacteroidetes bacterium GWD2_40_43]OFX95153.1 MAG: 23S rRNA (adenine(2503)-C(2))-methyltransferase [Bacteroidetes bacterium GWE2_40_63]OFY19236.1 MAG: 23S rRNA (adenine(2503)-C(2))-methyltransferase [Bacteroidetes bacterium GWF2_40_13]OFZ308
MAKEKLFGKTLNELKEICIGIGMPSFTGRQIAQWLYQKEVFSIDGMTNLSAKNREQLNQEYEIGLESPIRVQESSDGTKKYLFNAKGDNFIETAMIPDSDRKTVCVSSQVGCKMGCLFCMTARQGFQANLTAGEIINQFRSIPEWPQVTNLVYMGMGEPFDNLNEVLKSLEILTSDWGYGMSPKRITVSTIGIIPGMKTFLEQSNCHLAVSMHTPFDEERKKLMPVEQVYALEEVVKHIRAFDFGLQRRVSFEYIMFKGLNDTPRHVKELIRLLNGIRCRLNLIRFHPIPDSPLEGSSDETIMEFKDALNRKGLLTTLRASRGQDIYAACGLLSTKELVKKQERDY